MMIFFNFISIKNQFRSGDSQSSLPSFSYTSLSSLISPPQSIYLVSLNSSTSYFPSLASSNISQQFSLPRGLSGARYFCELGQWHGGGKMTSIDSLNACSNILGMILPRSLLLNSRQGFVFTQISHTLKFQSIMKSRPKTSKLC